jgi:hypothetical protein
MCKFQKTLHPGGIRTQDLLFCRRTQYFFFSRTSSQISDTGQLEKDFSPSSPLDVFQQSTSTSKSDDRNSVERNDESDERIDESDERINPSDERIEESNVRPAESDMVRIYTPPAATGQQQLTPTQPSHPVGGANGFQVPIFPKVKTISLPLFLVRNVCNFVTCNNIWQRKFFHKHFESTKSESLSNKYESL